MRDSNNDSHDILEVKCGQQITVGMHDLYWYVYASTPYGNVFRHFQEFRTQEGAERFANRIRNYIEAGGSLQVEYWSWAEFIKDSAAWQDHMEEDIPDLPLFYSRW